MKNAERTLTEADITINGAKLTFAQAMTLRVALSGFRMDLACEGTAAALGEQLTAGYTARAAEVEALMFLNLTGSTPPETLLTVTREGPLIRTEFDTVPGLLEALAAAATLLLGEPTLRADVQGYAAQLISAIRHPARNL